jgi:hypothetical protein
MAETPRAAPAMAPAMHAIESLSPEELAPLSTDRQSLLDAV